MEAFAERGERELLATGEHVRKRKIETRDELTAQEAQVARLARDGLSNAEIGARLFVSQHTVAYHLRKVFTKLGITSRHELARMLPPEPSAAVHATTRVNIGASAGAPLAAEQKVGRGGSLRLHEDDRGRG
jgi:DNA-binding CsgD family transcriptional regulator